MEPARDTSPRLFDLPAFFGFAFTSVTSQSLERLFLAHLSRKTKKKQQPKSSETDSDLLCSQQGGCRDGSARRLRVLPKHKNTTPKRDYNRF